MSMFRSAQVLWLVLSMLPELAEVTPALEIKKEVRWQGSMKVAEGPICHQWEMLFPHWTEPFLLDQH